MRDAYWLFKAKDDDIVKLYRLTSLSQQDSGILPGQGDWGRAGKASDTNETAGAEEDNPF